MWICFIVVELILTGLNTPISKVWCNCTSLAEGHCAATIPVVKDTTWLGIWLLVFHTPFCSVTTNPLSTSLDPFHQEFWILELYKNSSKANVNRRYYIVKSLQCCILARTSLFSSAYVSFWSTVRKALAHRASGFGPVTMSTNEHFPPPTPTPGHGPKIILGGKALKKRWKEI